ncbi:MAG TPA: FAD:protein FMN transferase [Actinomycetota bacterium]|nr:FAD:protein FMN transferase [Actinomycetota bacterium]
MSAPASASFPSIGTTAQVVVADGEALDAARIALEDELDRIDLACSRFRDDSELSRVNARAGRWTDVSAAFEEALQVALRAARATDGIVDPTLGACLETLGYDRDFAAITHAPARPVEVPRADWRTIELLPGRVRIPRDVKLDLGATAKALVADRAAARAFNETGSATLVNLGGDISVAGPAPKGGWLVRIADDHRASVEPDDPRVLIVDGGLATSSTTVRWWRRGAAEAHHIVDPATGEPARVVWRTVSVAARSCVDANTASTASIVLGDRALAWLAGLRLPARLVRSDGRIVTVGSWPLEAA